MRSGIIYSRGWYSDFSRTEETKETQGIGKTGRGGRAGAGDFLVKPGPGAGRSRAQATVNFALKIVYSYRRGLMQVVSFQT